MEKDERLTDVLARAKLQTEPHPSKPRFGHGTPEDPDNQKKRREERLCTAMALAVIKTQADGEPNNGNPFDPTSWMKNIGAKLGFDT